MTARKAKYAVFVKPRGSGGKGRMLCTVQTKTRARRRVRALRAMAKREGFEDVYKAYVRSTGKPI